MALAACRAPVDAATDRFARAVASLQQALAQAARRSSADQSELAWGHSLLGELFYWADLPARSEPELRRSLQLDPGDRYTRGVLADLLLDAGRFEQVRTLLAGQEADEALLLRLAIAEARLGGPRAPVLADDLRARFAAERRRGDDVHGREEARFLLELERQPARALTVARANWSVQREPWDARVLLAAARAAGDSMLAAPLMTEIDARGPGWALVARESAQANAETAR